LIGEGGGKLPFLIVVAGLVGFAAVVLLG